MRRKHLGVLFATACAVLAVAIPSTAAAREPAPGYSAFAGCPSHEENPNVEACTRSVITGAYFQMGSKNVPITNQMTLVGGLLPDGHLAANAKGGLSQVKQQVPGGVIGLTGLDWLVNFLNIEQLKLFAVTELVGEPLLGSTTLELPIRVHLVNPVLGNSCYAGSASNPITLQLTSETTSPPPPNKPITGKGPEFSFDPTTGIVHYQNGVFVDNAFAAPGASGCQLTLLGFIPINLDGLVNLEAGLPSPAGNNATEQDVNLEVAGLETVYP
jgi:hypothetical protein